MTGPKTRQAPLTVSEVAGIATELRALVGAQLQECLQTATELGLAFYHERQTVWLWIDLEPLCPLIVRLTGKAPGARKKVQRPLTLFLKSRFLGRRLESVQASQELGRVLIFRFHRAADEASREPCELEVRLFPHGQNVIARDGRSQVAENKPRDLPTSSATPAARA